MKYIRTKNGIYKATEINGMIVARGGVAYSCDIADVHFPIVFKEKDIINQANNIEDLCDRFVICGEPDYYELYEDFDEVKDLFYGENVTNIYGAIWTDKGLIFVAQLNNKGKLELL